MKRILATFQAAILCCLVFCALAEGTTPDVETQLISYTLPEGWYTVIPDSTLEDMDLLCSASSPDGTATLQLICNAAPASSLADTLLFIQTYSTATATDLSADDGMDYLAYDMGAMRCYTRVLPDGSSVVLNMSHAEDADIADLDALALPVLHSCTVVTSE